MMHANVRFVLCVFALPMVAMAQADTSSSIAPLGLPTRIGIISLQSAIVSTNDGQKDLRILEKKFDPKKIELKSIGDQIDGLKRQLETQGPKLNDEARTSLGRQIETKQKALSRAQEDAQNDYAEQQNEIVQRVLQRLIPVIDKYANDKGLSVVMDGSKSWPEWPLVWASPSVDITKAVVDIYNAQSAGPEPRSDGASRQVRPEKAPANASPASPPAKPQA